MAVYYVKRTVLLYIAHNGSQSRFYGSSIDETVVLRSKISETKEFANLACPSISRSSVVPSRRVVYFLKCSVSIFTFFPVSV